MVFSALWRALPHLSEISSTLSLLLWNGSSVHLIDNGSLSSFQGRSSNTSSFCSSVQVIDGVVALALSPLVMSQAPQYFTSSKRQCSPDWQWLCLILSGKVVKHFLFPCLSPGDQWCGGLGFVPTGKVSSSSTLQVFQETKCLRWLLCPPTCWVIFLDLRWQWMWNMYTCWSGLPVLLDLHPTSLVARVKIQTQLCRNLFSDQ